jgi:hypothetical protein
MARTAPQVASCGEAGGMTQNRSHAVMAQRAEPNDSLDFFPTPLWATRALFEHVIGPQLDQIGWDPCCGDGAMLRAMRDYMAMCAASDVHDYGVERAWLHDFLQPFVPQPLQDHGVSWILMNPPFRLGEQFIRRALEIASSGVAALVRTAFVESSGRYHGLFEPLPPAIIAQFVERVPMVKGRLDKTASTATGYCWLVWSLAGPRNGTRFIWIPPCRTQLVRPGDYP